jgi:lipopolysaccharide heptosyltransferase II
VTPGWDEARNVLAVRLDAIGDVLMTTPAIRALRGSPPHRSVTLLTSSAGAEVGRLVPEIDAVIAYDAPWMKASPDRPDPRYDLETIARLQALGFDAAVIFTVYDQDPLPAAFLCVLAGIPLRLAHTHAKPYHLLTDPLDDPEPERFVRHEVRRQLDLVAHVGARTPDEHLSLHVRDGAVARVRRRLAELGLDGRRPWFLLHPGATAPSRRYPAESFAAAARQLRSVHGWRAVVAGSGRDRDAVETIVRSVPDAISLVGELDLEDLAAAIALAPLLIANNSAPAHIAAAVGTPVVDLYALTNPQHTPWLVPARVLSHDVPCRSCHASVCPEGHHDCLRRVPGEAVVEAALELAAASPRPRGTSITPEPAGAA